MAEINLNMGIPKKATVSSIAVDTIVTHDVSEEFSLPDYVPEVRRILATKTQVLPESKYLSDSSSGCTLEFGGTVTYCIVYSDDEGRLCSTPLSSNYETQTLLSSHPETVFIDTVADNVSCRVNAPRKLTVKTRLKSRIIGFENHEVEENIENKSGEDEFFIERKYETISSVGVKSASLQNIHMADKFDASGLLDVRPIWCDAVVEVNESKAQDGAVSVKGSTTVKCVCDTADGIRTLSKSVPFSEEVEAYGCEDKDMVRTVARCSSLSISSEQNDGTEQLFFDAGCEFDCEIYRNEENMLTADCYSTKYETEANYKNIDTYSAVKCLNSSFTLSESIKRKNRDINTISEILCDPVYEKTEIKGQKAIIFGKLSVSIIGKSDSDGKESEYISDDYEIPFRYETDISRADGDILVRAGFDTGNASGRYDTDKFYCTAEILPSVAILRKGTSQVLASAVLKKDKALKKDASCVRVYFPKDSDTLWEVAKKYHTSQKILASRNDISSDTLAGIKDIII